MRVLVLGYSSIAQRRALPALSTLGTVEGVDIATRRAADPAVAAALRDPSSPREGGPRPRPPVGEVFADYQRALAQTQAELVYVSLVNSEHERWAQAALESGRHVVVDKPAFLGPGEAERMLELAAKRDRCLAEATVFRYHPQMAALLDVFAEAADAPTRAIAVLSFPPMDPANFRYDPHLGGGALWDLGPYAVAAGRVVFGEAPASLDCRPLAWGGHGVETAFSTLQTFSGGRSLVGHFGFDTAYCNRLEVLGARTRVELDRAFTTPPDHPARLQVTSGEGPTVREVPPADSFACFFSHVLASIQAHDWGQLGRDLLTDAGSLARLRSAAGVL